MIPALQYLRHGKALCGKVFKRFVETFNYHNDFIANLKGDGDLSTSDGCINLDRTDPTHPVIRLNRNNLGLPDGSSGDGGFPSPFDIVPDEDDPAVRKVVRCSIPCPVEAVSCDDYAIGGSDPVYLHVDRSANGYVATVDQTSRANGASHAQFKLYELDEDGNPTLDCRPTALPLFAF